MTYLIEVRTKKGLFDAFGDEVRRNIGETGAAEVSAVSVSQLYRIEGDIVSSTARTIAREILIDRVAQEFVLAKRTAKKNVRVIEVWFKPGVTDTVADTVLRAASDAGIKTPLRVATGKKYALEGNVGRAQAEGIARKLLANELVEDYVIT